MKKTFKIAYEHWTEFVYEKYGRDINLTIDYSKELSRDTHLICYRLNENIYTREEMYVVFLHTKPLGYYHIYKHNQQIIFA